MPGVVGVVLVGALQVDECLGVDLFRHVQQVCFVLVLLVEERGIIWRVPGVFTFLVDSGFGGVEHAVVHESSASCGATEDVIGVAVSGDSVFL